MVSEFGAQEVQRRDERAAGVRLMLVTDRNATAGRPLLDVVEAALHGGADAVQLREKDLGGRDLLELARRLLPLCRRYGARLLVNDRLDVALACDADGVQLPAASFALADARCLLGQEKLIGASTHTLAEVAAAARAGADFAVFGPVFDTPAKRAYGPPVGLDALEQAARAATIPVLAIGGITPTNAADVHAHGAAGVAAIGALLTAADPAAAARALRCALGAPA